MSPQNWIYLLITLSVIGAVGSVWQWKNLKGYKARSHRKISSGKKKRKSDKRKLSSLEKKQLAQSKKLTAQKKYLPAAVILEQLNMYREAIQLLEDKKHYDEAAAILMRMQRPNRAGVVYARHGIWTKAAECFRIANMPAEVAKCAREAGDHNKAGQYFSKANRHGDAADSYRHCKNFRAAAEHYLAIEETQKAMSMYRSLADSTEHIHALEFSTSELTAMGQWLIAGNFDKALANIINVHNRGAEVVLSLLKAGNQTTASEVYTASAGTTDIGPALMADINYQTNEAPLLAQLFESVCSYAYAGMVYEQMKVFDKAAIVFEKAGDNERAGYCYERSGKLDKAAEMKAAGPSQKKTIASGGPAAFSLAANETQHNEDFQEEDCTAVLMQAEAVQETVAPTKTIKVNPNNDHEAAGATPPPPPATRTNFSLSDEQTPVADADLGPTVPSVPPQENPYAEEPGNSPEYAEFATTSLLSVLDDTQKRELWNAGETKQYRNEDVIHSRENSPDGIYFILRGSVKCYRDLHNREASFMDELSSGDSFGELYVLAEHPISINFVACNDTAIRVISTDSFQKLLDKNGTISRKLYKSFTMRLINKFATPQNNTENKEAS